MGFSALCKCVKVHYAEKTEVITEAKNRKMENRGICWASNIYDYS